MKRRIIQTRLFWLTLGFAVWITAMFLAIPGCGGARITPAVNKVDAVQTSSGPSERILVTIGEPKPTPSKGAK